MPPVPAKCSPLWAVDDGLYATIYSCVQQQFDVLIRPPRPPRLVVFVGNGLTRIAAAMSGKEDLSWHQWVTNCLKKTQARQKNRRKPPLDYLLSLGYTADRIFSYLGNQEGADQTEFLMSLYKWYSRLRPSPLHEAILDLASQVITTNYDDLLEAVEGTHWTPWDCLNATRSPPRGKCIWKVHGSLPPRGDPNARGKIGAGDLRLALKTKTYHDFGFGAKALTAGLKRVVQELSDPDALVVFFGIGLGGEELILSRLFREASPPRHRNWLAVEICEELDPLHKLEFANIAACRVPLGLAASSERRALAMFAVLHRYAERFGDDISTADGSSAAARLLGLLRSHLTKFPRPSPKTAFVDTRPLITAVGQAAWNRMVGLEDGVAQEGAYNSREATWEPGRQPRANRDKRPLVSHEVGGQALIPTLIWDALGIPCALCSQVAGDELGSRILGRLAKTHWIDFQDVRQLTRWDVPGDHRAPMTPNSTMLAWFGIRTIIDHAPGMSFVAAPESLKWRPPVVYLTKQGFPNAQEELRNTGDWEPLIVFETGGIGDLHAESWVASRYGIVLASAVAALRWFALSVDKTECGFPADLWHRNYATRAVDTRIVRVNNEPCDIERRGRDWFKHWRVRVEPRDDRGRLKQVRALLDIIEFLKGKIPRFLKGALKGLRLYAVTVGEIGIVYWIKEGEHWRGPCWSRCPDAEHATSRKHYDELRNGAECGDVARAGFVAALLAATDFNHRTAALLQPKDLERALEWANWFGAWKIRYFSVEDYVQFIKSHQSTLLAAMRARAAGGAVPDPRISLAARTDPLLDGAKLCDDAAQVRNRYAEYLRDPKGQEFRKEVARWAGKRGVVFKG